DAPHCVVLRVRGIDPDRACVVFLGGRFDPDARHRILDIPPFGDVRSEGVVMAQPATYTTDTEGPVIEAKGDRKSTRLNSSHVSSSYAVFCVKIKSITYGHRGLTYRNDS